MTTTLRIDDQLKRDCDEVFEELGLTLTSAVNVFLRQVVRSRSIPFIIGAIPAYSPVAQHPELYRRCIGMCAISGKAEVANDK